MTPESRAVDSRVVRASLPGVDPDALDEVGGYLVREITSDNAARYGYAATDLGLKVRRHGRHLAGVADLSEALRVILDDVARSVRLVGEATDGGRLWEAMLARDDTD